MKVGSYVFDPDFVRGVMIKWEGDTDAVHGIEPFAHLSPELSRWAHDERLVQPMRTIVDDPEPSLFTEKLNLKRPRLGGPNPLHQDYPYWLDSAQDPLRRRDHDPLPRRLAHRQRMHLGRARESPIGDVAHPPGHRHLRTERARRGRVSRHRAGARRAARRAPP